MFAAAIVQHRWGQIEANLSVAAAHKLGSVWGWSTSYIQNTLQWHLGVAPEEAIQSIRFLLRIPKGAAGDIIDLGMLVKILAHRDLASSSNDARLSPD
jgi:hypothetical protein